MHKVSSSEIYAPKDALQVFISDNIVEELLLCTNLQGRWITAKWNALKKEELLAFIGVLLLAGVEKNWDLDIGQLFLDQRQDPFYKAAFGINKFENKRRHLRFNDKRTRNERLKHDKLAAISYIWRWFIDNCKFQFFLGAYTTVDEQLVPFTERCAFKQYTTSKPAKIRDKSLLAVRCISTLCIQYKDLRGKTTRITTGEEFGTKCCCPTSNSTLWLREERVHRQLFYFTSATLAKICFNTSWRLLGRWRNAKERFLSAWKLPRLEKLRHQFLGTTINWRWSVMFQRRIKL